MRHRINNLLVLSEKLLIDSSASEYITSANLNSENEYFEYKKIEEKDLTFTDSSKSKIFIFEARYNNSTKKLKFLQTANICKDRKAFFITLAIPSTITDYKKYEYILSTFNCKK